MIEVSSLVKYYGDIRAVDGVSFEVRKGEVVGFLGPNGAGKTTTMQILTGYLNPTSGRVLIDGIDVVEEPVKVKERIGYLPENTPLYEDLTPYDFLEFIVSVRSIENGRKAIKETAELCGIMDVLHRSIGTLSKGYRQRVGIAQAILHNPKILILDEPTTGLDPLQIEEIRQLIRELGKEKTILLSTHILPEVEQTCSRVIVINNGKIVADSPIETLKGELSGASVVVEYRGEVKPEALSIFGSVQTLKTEDGIYSIRITPHDNRDIREEVFRFFKEKDAVLLELYRERRTLEDIFRQLTEQ